MNWRPEPATRSLTVRDTSTSPGQGKDARGDVDADSRHPVAPALDFAGVKARPYLDTEVSEQVAQGERTADGSRRTVETGEQTVSGEVRDDPAELGDLALG